MDELVRQEIIKSFKERAESLKRSAQREAAHYVETDDKEHRTKSLAYLHDAEIWEQAISVLVGIVMRATQS